MGLSSRMSVICVVVGGLAVDSRSGECCFLGVV